MKKSVIHLGNEQDSLTQIREESPTLAKIEVKEAPSLLVKADDGLIKAPTTTIEQNLATKGQRRINLIWEVTQAIIAASVTGAFIRAEFGGVNSEGLSNAFTLIIAVYFVRMNHVKIGGVGGTDTR